MFRLRCPNCGNFMNYMTRESQFKLREKRKSCVYCGKSFKVVDNIKSTK